MACTYGVTLEELLNYPTDLLVLRGADNDDPDNEGGDNDEDDDEDDSDGDGDDDDEDSDDEDDEDGDDDDSSDSDKSKKNKAKKDKPSDEDKDRIATLEGEVERHKKRRTAAEERVTRLLNEVKDLKANGTKDADLKKEYEEARATNQTLTAEIATLRLNNAFLQSNKFEWADSKAALKLVDMSDVEVDDKGEVQGLEAALQKLAKDAPYLLKPKQTPRRTPADKTGDRPSSTSRKTTTAKRKAEEQDLLNRYPALRR